MRALALTLAVLGCACHHDAFGFTLEIGADGTISVVGTEPRPFSTLSSG